MTWNEPERNILGAKLNQSRTFSCRWPLVESQLGFYNKEQCLWSRLYVSFMCSTLSNEHLLPLCLVSWSNSGFVHLHFRWSNLYFLLRQLTVGLKWSIVWLKVSFLIPSQLTIVTEFPLETRKSSLTVLKKPSRFLRCKIGLRLAIVSDEVKSFLINHMLRISLPLQDENLRAKLLARNAPRDLFDKVNDLFLRAHTKGQ